MLQEYATPLPLLLVVTTHLACLVAVAASFFVPSARFPGWQVIKPGGIHWFSLIGGWSFSLLITWTWLFIGSARPDAETQMNTAFVLIVAFGAGTAWSGFNIAHLRRAAVRWQGSEIRWKTRDKEVSQEMSQFEEIYRGWDNRVRVRFRDGTILKLDRNAQNAVGLTEVIWQSIGHDPSSDGSMH